MLLVALFLVSVVEIQAAFNVKTPCGPPPEVNMGTTQLQVSTRNGVSTYKVTYTCMSGFQLQGVDGVSQICAPGDTAWKTPKPRCVSTGGNFDFITVEEVTTDEPTTTIKYTGRLVGGSTGPQCLPGVASTHSSCYANGAGFVRSVPVPVDEVLAAHNKWRRSVNPPAQTMPDLQWNDQLAIEAERQAARCILQHDTYDARSLPPRWRYVGQNLFWGYGKTYSWTEAVNSWGNEVNKPGWTYGQAASSGVGHYTQIIWADTTHVGCGKADCGSKGQFMACNYGPAGNFNNQQPYVAAGAANRVATTTTTTRKPAAQTTTTRKPATRTTTKRPVVTVPTTTTKAPSGRLVGGSTGPRCLPGVAATHSSCYANGASFVRTVPVPVDEVLAVHNKWRRSVNPPAKKTMPDLQWDDQLAIEAERHAARCLFQHDSSAARALPAKWPAVGQNLFWGSGLTYSWTEAVNKWGNEVNDPGWTYGQGFSSGTGHYTQVVWADTTHVGCGKADCGSAGQFMTCNYGPAGNYVGQQPYVRA